jgi:serine/threonine-protein kinase RsbW
MNPSPSSQPESGVLHLTNQRADIDQAEGALLGALGRFGYPEASQFAVRLAIEEALVNAFRHGHKDLPPETPVRFEFSVTPAHVNMSIEDRGPGFNPSAVKDPTLEENLELPTGRGLLLIRAYMSRVEYNAKGNKLSMTYSRPADAKAAG